MEQRNKLLLSGACLLLALLIAVGGTFAWLSKEQTSEDAYTGLSDFEVEGELSFGGTAYAGATLLVPVSFTPGDPNYIGSMKYVVRYRGVSPAYVRVRVLEQWLDTAANEVLPVSFLDYSLTGDARILKSGSDSGPIPAAGEGTDTDALAQSGVWVDSRSTDYCYYYSVPVQPKSLSTPKTGGVALGDGQIELTLFEQTEENTAGLIEGITSDTTQLTLLIEVEAVQPNRIREFWGIDAVPQP